MTRIFMPNSNSQLHPIVERFARLTAQETSDEVEKNDSDENVNVTDDEKENKNKYGINNFDKSIAKVDEEEVCVCNFYII